MSRVPRPDIKGWFTKNHQKGLHRKIKSYVNKTDPGVTTVTHTDDVLREVVSLEKVKDWAWKHFGLEKDSSLLKELGEKE